MALFEKSNNPFLNEKRINQSLDGALVGSAETSTVSGAINKTFILTALLLATAMIGFVNPSPTILFTGAIGGLVFVLISVFKPHLSAYLAPAYALFEGLFVGAITSMYGGLYDGIIIQAVGLTISALVMMLVLYKTGMITVTEKFRSGVIMATGAVVLVYIMGWIFGMFGYNIPYIHEGGMLGIGFSLLVIGIGCLNLLLDFDNFDKAEEHRAPKYMEWFCAMGLLITLVWLYVEFLRLLAKLNND